MSAPTRPRRDLFESAMFPVRWRWVRARVWFKPWTWFGRRSWRFEDRTYELDLQEHPMCRCAAIPNEAEARP